LILNDSSYVFERWHGTMFVIAIAVFAIIFNTFLARKLPMVEGLILIIYIVGFFAIIVPLWVLAPRNSPKAVFTEFTNNGGWSSMGTSVMIGLSGTIASMAGFDCAVHMGE
jgi:amino acid transporter